MRLFILVVVLVFPVLVQGGDDEWIFSHGEIECGPVTWRGIKDRPDQETRTEFSSLYIIRWDYVANALPNGFPNDQERAVMDHFEQHILKEGVESGICKLALIATCCATREIYIYTRNKKRFKAVLESSFEEGKERKILVYHYEDPDWETFTINHPDNLEHAR